MIPKTLLTILSFSLLSFTSTSTCASASPTRPLGRSDFQVLAGAPMDGLNITASPLPLTQCGVVNISWAGGNPPYRLMIGTGGYYVNNSMWLYEYDNLTSPTWFEWVVNATTNSSMNFQIFDVVNKTENIQNLVVLPGNSSCYNVTTFPGHTVNSTTVVNSTTA